MLIVALERLKVQGVPGRTMAGLAGVFVLLLVTPIIVPRFYVTLLALSIVYGLFAFGLDIAWGRTGLVSIGHAVFFGLGAYGVAIATTRDISTLLGAAVGIGIAGLVAIVIGWSGLRARATASTMAVLTLGATLLAAKVATAWVALTNGTNGLFVRAPSSPALYFWICAVVAATTVVLCWQLIFRARIGNRLTAIRINEQRASHLGINVTGYKVFALVVSAAVSAVAGALVAPLIGLVSPPLLGIILSTQVLVWVAMGGRNSIMGPFLGALVVTVGQNLLSDVSLSYYLLALGVIFVIVVVAMPDGLIGRFRRLGTQISPQFAPGSAAEHTPFPPKEAVLRVNNIVKTFGGTVAVDDVSFEVAPGEIVCLIGPNGAGKSTLLNVVSGQVRPNSGTVELLGHECTTAPSHARARLGLGRTFQVPSLFAELTVAEHIFLARQEGEKRFTLPRAYHRFEPKPNALPTRHVESSTRVQDLPLGERRSLELALVLARGPRLLLLDEPTAGLSVTESHALSQTLRDIRDELGCAMVVVEHDMEVVRTLADRVIVLHRGRILKEGSMADVAADAAVRAAYLGEA